MSNEFKMTIATMALLVVGVLSLFNLIIVAQGCSLFECGPSVSFIFLGIFEVISYGIFLKTHKNLFFLLTVTPFFLIVLWYFIYANFY